MTNSLEPSPFAAGETTSSSAWRWRLEDAAGTEVTSSEGSPSFPSQSDAETWVGEVWRDLADDGVDQVTLFEGDRQVYGPMSLHAAQ
ncbi:hypothetical protein [Nocardioides mesophilus]|uniref:Uncharacterized protein n=1 Tax=Nocardioides mesophilus TaxID=433659 RepID=A0A7G9RC79_9ACTN|nr:hypothetical protein [Nocardioides mesophilus]QNN53204.1 hypothetical protein H9L09_01550 [Nocardioides mesophilus]